MRSRLEPPWEGEQGSLQWGAVGVGLKLCEDHKSALRRERVRGRPLRFLCPRVCLLVGPSRCAPEKCKSFTISGSPGVLVDIHNTSPLMTKEETATTRWPLSDPMDVLVNMISPSSAPDGDKVSLGAGGGGVESPRGGS